MGRVVDVEIDTRDVGLAATVLVSLEQKMPPVIEAGSWTARVTIKDEIGILIGLGAVAVAEKAEFGDNTIRVLKRIGTRRNHFEREVRINDRRRGAGGLIGAGNAVADPADTEAIIRTHRSSDQCSECYGADS